MRVVSTGKLCEDLTGGAAGGVQREEKRGGGGWNQLHVMDYSNTMMGTCEPHC